MYKTALVTSKSVELFNVIEKTSVVFSAPTVKGLGVDGVLAVASATMGVPSQVNHSKDAVPVAGDQRSDVT